MLHTITNLLSTNQYVIVIALDFSKTFDTVRHHTLPEKLAQLDIPDNIYNWMVNFFNGHQHSTTYDVSWGDIGSARDLRQHHRGLADRSVVVCRQYSGFGSHRTRQLTLQVCCSGKLLVITYTILSKSADS